MRAKFFELNEIEKDIIYNHMWPGLPFLLNTIKNQKERDLIYVLLPTNIAGHARQVKEDDDERIGEKRFPYPFFGIYVEQFLEGATVSDKFSTFHML